MAANQPGNGPRPEHGLTALISGLHDDAIRLKRENEAQAKRIAELEAENESLQHDNKVLAQTAVRFWCEGKGKDERSVWEKENDVYDSGDMPIQEGQP